MTLELITFLVLALVAIATALGMLLSRNAVYSALFLVMNFITVAVFYLLLGAPFIAMAQITVYAGAIMVLFLFVIMLLGAEAIVGEFRPRNLIFPGAVGVVLIVEAAYLLVTRARPAGVAPRARRLRLVLRERRSTLARNAGRRGRPDGRRRTHRGAVDRFEGRRRGSGRAGEDTEGTGPIRREVDRRVVQGRGHLVREL